MDIEKFREYINSLTQAEFEKEWNKVERFSDVHITGFEKELDIKEYGAYIDNKGNDYLVVGGIKYVLKDDVDKKGCVGCDIVRRCSLCDSAICIGFSNLIHKTRLGDKIFKIVK